MESLSKWGDQDETHSSGRELLSFNRPSGRNTCRAACAIFQPASDRSYRWNAVAVFFQAQRAATAAPAHRGPVALHSRDPAIGRFGLLPEPFHAAPDLRKTRRASWVVWNTSRPFSNGGFPSCCRCCCTAAIPACRPVPASARTYESAEKSCNARDQVDPVRSLAFWPKNQTMLVGGSIPDE